MFDVIQQFLETANHEVLLPFLSEAKKKALEHDLIVWGIIFFIIRWDVKKFLKKKTEEAVESANKIKNELIEAATNAKNDIALAVKEAKDEFTKEIKGVTTSIETLSSTIKKVEETHFTENNETNRRLDRHGDQIKELIKNISVDHGVLATIQTEFVKLKELVLRNTDNQLKPKET